MAQSNIFTCVRERGLLDEAYKDKINCAMMYEDSSTSQMLINKINYDYDARVEEMDQDDQRKK